MRNLINGYYLLEKDGSSLGIWQVSLSIPYAAKCQYLTPFIFYFQNYFEHRSCNPAPISLKYHFYQQDQVPMY